MSFPPTERFFIDAVRDNLDRVSDPVLRRQVGDFIHQEAMHNKVHTSCNAILARDYPNCSRAERISLGLFRFLGKLPRRFRLSLSSALEHFTSMVADTLLRYPTEFSKIFPREVAEMWIWHAAEETEHKSVCFDVYCSAYGNGPLSYVDRVLGMLLATPLFLFVMLAAGAVALGQPRVSAAPASPVAPPLPEEPAAPADAVESSDADRFMGRNILTLLWQSIPWRVYFSYYRPSFHPWDHDNRDLIATWKSRYPGFGVGTASVRP